MFKELEPCDYSKVKHLFQEFEYSLSIKAIFEGINCGKIFVDNIECPTVALAFTVEGSLLSGDHSNSSSLASLNEFFKELFSGNITIDDEEDISLAVYPSDWEGRLQELIPTHEPEKIKRFHYLCHDLDYDWRNQLLDYSVHQMDESFFKLRMKELPDEFEPWLSITENWGTLDNFLENGIGYYVLHSNNVVAVCTADCTAGKQIDIGIVTLPEYRQKGLASLVTAATVDYCFNSGFDIVGWHCDADNVGSWKTAEKVGFKRVREYYYYNYKFDIIDHLAELGWHYLKMGEYEKTVECYEQLFSMRDNHPFYYYLCAARAWAGLNNPKNAVRYLSSAIEEGFSSIESLEQIKEFKVLHDTEEWHEILIEIKRRRPE